MTWLPPGMNSRPTRHQEGDPSTMKRLLLLALALLLAACAPAPAAPAPTAAQTLPPAPAGETLPAPAQEDAVAPVTIEPQGFVRNIHDPVIAKEGNTYYVFSTGARIIIICSHDLVEWEFCGRVFERYPAWTLEVNPELVDAWAPDISFFNGKWHLYYAVSSFGTQNSAIGLATNATLDPASPDYAWADEGEVLRSQPGDPWNAIDANLVLDETGQPWLAFGSFWEGIHLRKLDATTGKPAADDPTFYKLASRRGGPDQTDAIEAPFILRRGGFYYLFASFDACCRGAESTYNVRVGRSEAITGPYVDREGRSMTEGGGTLILEAYGKWRGPGHNGLLVEGDTTWLVYHAYDAQQNGIPKLRVEPVLWDAAGWPTLPSQAN